MATKKNSAAFDFLVESLKADKASAYADLKAKAEKKGLLVYPVMFGRAKTLLGLVKSAKRGRGKAAKAKAVTKAKRRSPKSKATAKKRGRPVGGGSKSGQVRALLARGMTAAEIAAKVGCTVGLVYNVKSKAGASGGAIRRGAGRSKKAASALQSVNDGSLEAIVQAVKSSGVETARLRKALERIRDVLESVL